MKGLFGTKSRGGKGVAPLAAIAAVCAGAALLLFAVCSDNKDDDTTPPNNPCEGLSSAQPGSACCQAQPSFNGCIIVNPPPGGEPSGKYCYWGVGECWPIQPDTPCDAPCDAGLTQYQNCQQNGFVSSSSTCSDAPTEDYYCYWDGTGCSRISNPNAINPDNPDKTEKEVCEAYGFLSTSPTCADYVAPDVVYYCDWDGAGSNCWRLAAPDALKTDCGDPPGSDSCPAGMTNKSACEAWATLVTCTGSDRPSDGSCCSH